METLPEESRSGDSAGHIIELSHSAIPEYAEVIRQSFATVAKEFGLTRENCPTHTSFITDEALSGKIGPGYFPFGYSIDGRLVGFASLTDVGSNTFELNHLAVLPEYRHRGCGKALLDFCRAKALEKGGVKITIGIVEESTILKNWYADNGFVHIGTHKFSHLPFTVGFMEMVLRTE